MNLYRTGLALRLQPERGNMYQYRQTLHSYWCAWLSGSPAEPCNCPASEEIKTKLYACSCGKSYGLKHGLITHQRMSKHKLSPKK